MDNIDKHDQAAAFLGDNYPPLWKRLYDNCVKEGFTEAQAMDLVRTYIFANCGGKWEK